MDEPQAVNKMPANKSEETTAGRKTIMKTFAEIYSAAIFEFSSGCNPQTECITGYLALATNEYLSSVAIGDAANS